MCCSEGQMTLFRIRQISGKMALPIKPHSAKKEMPVIGLYEPIIGYLI